MWSSKTCSSEKGFEMGVVISFGFVFFKNPSICSYVSLLLDIMQPAALFRRHWATFVYSIFWFNYSLTMKMTFLDVLGQLWHQNVLRQALFLIGTWSWHWKPSMLNLERFGDDLDKFRELSLPTESDNNNNNNNNNSSSSNNNNNNNNNLLPFYDLGFAAGDYKGKYNLDHNLIICNIIPLPGSNPRQQQLPPHHCSWWDRCTSPWSPSGAVQGTPLGPWLYARMAPAMKQGNRARIMALWIPMSHLFLCKYSREFGLQRCQKGNQMEL